MLGTSPDAGGVFCSPPLGKVFRATCPRARPCCHWGKLLGPVNLPHTPDSRTAHPLWRLDRTGTTSFGPDFPLHSLVAMGNEIFALSRKKDEGRSEGRPSFAVLQLDGVGHAKALAQIRPPEGTRLKLHAGNHRIWAEADAGGFKWPGDHWIQALEPWYPGMVLGPEDSAAADNPSRCRRRGCGLGMDRGPGTLMIPVTHMRCSAGPCARRKLGGSLPAARRNSLRAGRRQSGLVRQQAQAALATRRAGALSSPPLSFLRRGYRGRGIRA